MECNNKEIEDKVKKIMKLIKSKEQEDQDGSTENLEADSELVSLIKDFHDQYQSLCSQYNNLRGEPQKGYRFQKEKEVFSSSSSDSEYYSSEDIEINTSNMRNGVKKDFKTSKPGAADMKQKFVTANKEKESLNSEYHETLSKLKAAENMNKILRDEADERKRELAAFVKEHEVHGSRASAQIKELEDHLSSVKLELEVLLGQKTDLEVQCASKETEAKQLEEKNIGLHAQISKLELMSEEKGNEIANLVKKLKEHETNLTSKIKDLMAQVSHLQSEVESLRGLHNEATDHVKLLRDQVSLMQRDLVSLTSLKIELESQMEAKNKEISEYLIQVKSLKEELTKKAAVEQRMLKEKEGFLVRVKDLELEMEAICNQKKKWEDLLNSRIHETKKLREEKERLHARISEMEDQITALQRKCGSPENEPLNTQKSQKDLQIANEKLESSHSLAELEQQDIKLTTKISYQQRILRGQEETISKLTEELRQVKRRISGSKMNLQVAERKMSEMAEEFRKKLEDNIRVLYQRILVAEQLHNENKDNYKKTKERLQEESRVLEKKVASHEAELRTMRDIFQPGNNAFSGLDLVVRKFEGDGDLVSRISNISNELVCAKTWVSETNNQKKKLQEEVDCLVEQLDDKEEQESFLKDKIWNLEAKLGSLGEEKLNLLQSVSQLEKQIGELEKKIEEKDEVLFILSEEKREAIRQLCVLMDYYRNQCNSLKGEISKMALQSSRARNVWRII